MKSVFDIPIDQMPRVAAGDAIRAKDFNAVSKAIERIQKGVAYPQQVIPIPRGGSGELIACKIVSIHRNHLVCTRKDGGGTINVARPRAARSPDSELVLAVTWNYTSYSSDFQHRTAVHSQVGGLTERQVVLREYKVNDIIRATRIAGGTDTEIASANTTEAPDYEEVHTDRTWYRDVATP